MPEKISKLFAHNGWSFRLSMPGSEFEGVTVLAGAEDAGLVIYDVAHGGHLLASDIRAVSIWINIGTNAPFELRLGLADFDVLADVFMRPEPGHSQMGLTNAMHPPYQFSDYPTVAFVRAVFRSKQVLFSTGYRLRVTQTYILTGYSASPAHEPLGSLSAARIFPLLTFETIDDQENVVNGPSMFRSIRIDYRLRLKLDVFLTQANLDTVAKEQKEVSPQAFAEAIKAGPQQVGLFRDVNEPITDSFVAPITPSTTVFSSAEKPIKWELYALGLLGGKDYYGLMSDSKGVTRYTWHNIHWWGGYKKYNLPSAPGAFHAAHLHWKWGDYVQEWAIFPPHLGEKQFKGGKIGGALLDANIRRQDIEICVVKQADGMRLGPDVLSTMTGMRPKSDPIEDGAVIECWYSPTAGRVTEYFDRGTFFIHGLFFAHDPEPSWSLTGPTDPLYKNPDTPDHAWQRQPKGPFLGPRMH